MKIKAFFFCIAIALFQNPDPIKAQEIAHRVYLIGDAGELTGKEQPVLDMIKKQSQSLQSEGVKIDFLFLGDNIYPKGMPGKSHPLRKVSEEILDLQIQLVGNENRGWFIPGNHDWEQGKPTGLSAILRQQAYIDSLDAGNLQWPIRDGCPGPEEIKLNESTIMVLLDSQWWLHPYEKGGPDSGCEFKTKEDVVFALKDIFLRNRDKVILLAIHHPLYTYGEHNGAYGFKQHLFPLTEINSKLWLPLPVIGSIYPIYRSVFGNIQDLVHPEYKDFKERLEPLIAEHSCVIVASGHEHVLQYLKVGKAHHIVSGSAAKTSRLRKNNPLDFGSVDTGFATLDYLRDSSMTVSFYNGISEIPIFSRNIRIDEKIAPYEIPNEIVYQEKLWTPSSNRYTANKRQVRLLGENYRKEWQTEVQLPVININEKYGGLEIIKRGGGMQTRSLRLKDSTGVEYTLRSVDKYPEMAVPSILRKSVAKEIVQDQISASNPFGALIIPPLAQAAGVLHNVPEMVWLPDEPSLKFLREDFAEKVYLFEKRDVTADMIPFTDFKIHSTDKVIAKIQKDNDNLIQQESVLRARILDLFIGDWDRHDDQWRWVGKKTEKGWEFFPVPRDRDQAFFVNQGFIPRIASRKWIMPKLQGFDHEIRDINSFMFNARYFDRNFLNGLGKEQWERIIWELLESWTDDVIESAMDKLPDEIKKIQAESITSKLKHRRNWILEKGLEYYSFLAQEVDIVGTAKREKFEVDFQESGNVKVTVKKISNKNILAQSIHERIYFPEETKELRLYGMGGEDEFVILGRDMGNGIKIRIISGESSNYITDTSQGEKSSVEYYLYSGQNDHLNIKSGSKVHKSKDIDILDYNRREFKYIVVSPIPSLEFNVDDGIYLGGGVSWNKHEFRKDPYKISQSIKGNSALLTGAFNFYYSGHAVDVFSKWDLEWQADIMAPNYIYNFYGFGNETSFSRENFDPRFFWVRINMAHASVFIRKPLGNYFNFKIGPVFDYAKLDENDNEGRFINNDELSGLDSIVILS